MGLKKEGGFMLLQINNMNGFAHVLSGLGFDDRAAITFGLYKDVLPHLWATCENATGGKSLHCLSTLQSLANRYDFTMVLPNDWNPSEHPKSILSILFLDKAKFKNIEVLPFDIELKNRVCFVKAICDKKEIYTLNVHVPQTDMFKGHSENDGYVRLRKHLAKELYDAIYAQVEKLIAEDKRVILMGDFNRTSQSDEIKKLISLGLVEVGAPADNREIDHILISKNILDEVVEATYELDDEIINFYKLTDHPSIRLNLEF